MCLVSFTEHLTDTGNNIHTGHFLFGSLFDWLVGFGVIFKISLVIGWELGAAGAPSAFSLYVSETGRCGICSPCEVWP